MGRKHNFVSVIATLLILASSCGWANGQPPRPSGRGPGPAHVRRVPSPATTRERWFSLPPEDRQVFRRNAERWMQMGPEERKLMRQRDKLYRERIKHEMDTVLHDTGLRLEGEKRDLFEQRYMQERRRIERALRQEAETKREQELPALKERLKKEFQETSPEAASTSAPGISAAPAPKK